MKLSHYVLILCFAFFGLHLMKDTVPSSLSESFYQQASVAVAVIKSSILYGTYGCAPDTQAASLGLEEWIYDPKQVRGLVRGLKKTGAIDLIRMWHERPRGFL